MDEYHISLSNFVTLITKPLHEGIRSGKTDQRFAVPLLDGTWLTLSLSPTGLSRPPSPSRTASDPVYVENNAATQNALLNFDRLKEVVIITAAGRPLKLCIDESGTTSDKKRGTGGGANPYSTLQRKDGRLAQLVSSRVHEHNDRHPDKVLRPADTVISVLRVLREGCSMAAFATANEPSKAAWSAEMAGKFDDAFEKMLKVAASDTLVRAKDPKPMQKNESKNVFRARDGCIYRG